MITVHKTHSAIGHFGPFLPPMRSEVRWNIINRYFPVEMSFFFRFGWTDFSWAEYPRSRMYMTRDGIENPKTPRTCKKKYSQKNTDDAKRETLKRNQPPMRLRNKSSMGDLGILQAGVSGGGNPG